MRKISLVLVITAVLSTQAIYADDMSMSSSDSKPCKAIAEACSKAGFVRQGMAGKRFWMDCMKPVVMGKVVQGVTVDSATVKACRANKITQLQKELNELQKASAM